jgi:hypothetical protein
VFSGTAMSSPRFDEVGTLAIHRGVFKLLHGIRTQQEQQDFIPALIDFGTVSGSY